jgi:hypothetical protein
MPKLGAFLLLLVGNHEQRKPQAPKPRAAQTKRKQNCTHLFTSNYDYEQYYSILMILLIL